MNDKYKEEIDALVERMEKAEAFAEKIPCLSKYILENKITESSGSTKFGNQYKEIPLNWGINRYWYKGTKQPTNYKGEYSGNLFNIYINTLTLYDLHEDFGLEEIIPKSSYFYYDKMNSNFYAEDETIEQLLDALNDWYMQAKEKAKAWHDIKRVEKLKEELEKIEGVSRER